MSRTGVNQRYSNFKSDQICLDTVSSRVESAIYSSPGTSSSLHIMAVLDFHSLVTLLLDHDTPLSGS